jgi:hypothetical protein
MCAVSSFVSQGVSYAARTDARSVDRVLRLLLNAAAQHAAAGDSVRVDMSTLGALTLSNGTVRFSFGSHLTEQLQSGFSAMATNHDDGFEPLLTAHSPSLRSHYESLRSAASSDTQARHRHRQRKSARKGASVHETELTRRSQSCTPSMHSSCAYSEISVHGSRPRFGEARPASVSRRDDTAATDADVSHELNQLRLAYDTQIRTKQQMHQAEVLRSHELLQEQRRDQELQRIADHEKRRQLQQQLAECARYNIEVAARRQQQREDRRRHPEFLATSIPRVATAQRAAQRGAVPKTVLSQLLADQVSPQCFHSAAVMFGCRWGTACAVSVRLLEISPASTALAADNNNGAAEPGCDVVGFPTT